MASGNETTELPELSQSEMQHTLPTVKGGNATGGLEEGEGGLLITISDKSKSTSTFLDEQTQTKLINKLTIFIFNNLQLPSEDNVKNAKNNRLTTAYSHLQPQLPSSSTSTPGADLGYTKLHNLSIGGAADYYKERTLPLNYREFRCQSLFTPTGYS